MPTTSLSHHYEVIWERDALSGTVIPLADIQVSVYKVDAAGVRDTVENTHIYTSRSGAVEKDNPFITNETGVASFWAEVGQDYDIEFVDTIVPARVNTTTIGWVAGIVAPAPLIVDLEANRPSAATLANNTRFVSTDSQIEWVVYDGNWYLAGGIPGTISPPRTQTNWTVGANARRTIDRNTYTIDQLYDYVNTLVYDLQQRTILP